MCGICGQFNFQSRQPVVETLIRAATHTLAHRGPDDEGFFVSGPVGLGFRRLSIIDLGLGHQPMSDDSGAICVVFNGEIYNYRELRRQLATFGHRFRTSSDTEVIVYGYKQWGDKVFDHLNGMFGLAIWDGTRQRLVLARDAMGIKPVYYTVTNGGICFGSEIRAVTSMLRGNVALDSTSLNLFLRYRYTPSPLTLFTGIRKLAPGTMAVVDEKGLRVERWYQFKPRLHAPTKTFREAKHELLGLYRDALRRHLISDVPVGLLLSAGIDSGLLLALIKDEGGGRPTYTVGYGPSFPDDELVAAAQTAAHFKARHVSVELTPESFERYLPAVVRSLEEPVAAASIVPMFAVCERARQDVKVALVGQGPDELFGGYPRHLGVHYGEYLAALASKRAAPWRCLPGSLAPQRRHQTRPFRARPIRPDAPLPKRVLDSPWRHGRRAVSRRRSGARCRRYDSGLLVRARRANGRNGRTRGLPIARGPFFTAGRTSHLCRQALDGARARGQGPVP